MASEGERAIRPLDRFRLTQGSVRDESAQEKVGVEVRQGLGLVDP